MLVFAWSLNKATTKRNAFLIMSLLISCPCWYHVLVDIVLLLISCSCWYHALVDIMPLLISCPCWYHAIVDTVPLLISCPCWYHVLVDIMSLLISCPCWYHVLVDIVPLLISCPCWYGEYTYIVVKVYTMNEPEGNNFIYLLISNFHMQVKLSQIVLLVSQLLYYTKITQTEYSN